VQKCTWWPLTSITTKCPDGQIAEQVKNAQETLGYQKIIVPNIPPGGRGAIASSKSISENKIYLSTGKWLAYMKDAIIFIRSFVNQAADLWVLRHRAYYATVPKTRTITQAVPGHFQPISRKYRTFYRTENILWDIYRCIISVLSTSTLDCCI